MCRRLPFGIRIPIVQHEFKFNLKTKTNTKTAKIPFHISTKIDQPPESNQTEPNQAQPDQTNERTNEFLIFETCVCYTQSLFCIVFQSDCISVAPNELTMQKCSLHRASNIKCGWIVVLLNVIHGISP